MITEPTISETGGTKSIRAVERAMDVLKCFGPETPTLSVTDLQRRLGLSRPTLYRLLHTLENKGMIRSWGDPQRFELDAGVVELAGSWLGKSDVAQAAQPFLSELWGDTDETVALFVRTSPISKICINELRSRQPLTFTRGAGFTESTTVGSSGKIMIAFMKTVEAELALAEISDPQARAALDAELVQIRRDGYSISSGEIIAGAIAIAAPVFNNDSDVAGSICLFGPEARLHGATREKCVTQLLETARKISIAIGHRPKGRLAEAAE
jgi:IclR family transcriptional regulator, acetate operon repressor